MAEKADADLRWLGTATDPWLVVMDHSDIGSYSHYYEVVQEFTCHTQLYSWPYIAFMKTQLSEAGRIRLLSIAAFLSIVKRTEFDPTKLSVLYDQFLNLKVGSTSQIETMAAAILKKKGKMEMSELLVAVAAAPGDAQATMKLTEEKKQSELEAE